MYYNTQPQLFVNLRTAILAKDACLRTSVTVTDGHVIHGRDVIARFPSNEDAITVLQEAGFVYAGNWSAESSVWSVNEQAAQAWRES